MAQGAAPGTPPARAEFVIRGAYVLPMDPSIADLPTGDVHVRDGTIIAVAPRIEAPIRHQHRWQRHDLHARAGRDALASLDQHPALLHARGGRPAHLFPGHCESTDRITRRKSATAARASALPKRCRPASPPRRTGTTTRAATSMPRPRCAPCTTSAFAAASPMAPRRAIPTTSRWTSPGLSAPSATGARKTACCCSRSAHAASTTPMPERAARSAPTWQRWNGPRRASLACRSRCTPRASAASRCSTRPACSAAMCSSFIRSTRPPRSARRWRATARATASPRSAKPAGRPRSSSSRCTRPASR